jgi:hypothetical protein
VREAKAWQGAHKKNDVEICITKIKKPPWTKTALVWNQGAVFNGIGALCMSLATGQLT